MRKVALSTVLLVGAIAPASASASERAIAVPFSAESPALAGERVMWTQLRAGGGLGVWAQTPGTMAKRVHAVAPPPSGFVVGRLAASPTRVILGTTAAPRTGVGAHDVYLGLPGAALELLQHCTEGPPYSVDVWEDAYVHRTCTDAEETGQVEITDLASPPLSPARTVGEWGFLSRIAGRYVTWIEGNWSPGASVVNADDIVVYDRVEDREVYRLTPAEVPGFVYSLAIQEDGKVAVSYHEGRSGLNSTLVGWASPEEPFIHPVPLPVRGEYMARMAKDLVAFHGGKSLDFTIQHAYVGVSDLAGNAHTIAKNTDAHPLQETFDFDGAQLVWRELGCQTARLVVRSVTAPGTAPGGATDCPLRLHRPAVVNEKTATLRFDCGAFPTPCEFSATLRLTGREKRLAGKTKRSTRNPVHINLTPTAVRRIKRHGSLAVNARVHLYARPNYRHEQIREGRLRLSLGS